MSTFANQLKSEISRLAKKEVRAETQALKKASTQYRSEIAALKRRLAGLEAQIKKQGKGAGRVKAAEKTDEESGASHRFRVAGFAALRKKLNISAAEMGKLLGVSAQSVYAVAHRLCVIHAISNSRRSYSSCSYPARFFGGRPISAPQASNRQSTCKPSGATVMAFSQKVRSAAITKG